MIESKNIYVFTFINFVSKIQFDFESCTFKPYGDYGFKQQDFDRLAFRLKASKYNFNITEEKYIKVNFERLNYVDVDDFLNYIMSQCLGGVMLLVDGKPTIIKTNITLTDEQYIDITEKQFERISELWIYLSDELSK